MAGVISTFHLTCIVINLVMIFSERSFHGKLDNVEQYEYYFEI